MKKKQRLRLSTHSKEHKGLKKTMKRLYLLIVISTLTIPFNSELRAQAKVTEFPINATDKLYSSVPLDIAINRLPPNYYGHDVKSIYDAVKNQEKKKTKGEFETIEQYHERRRKESTMPIIDSLFYDSFLAFFIYPFAQLEDDLLYDTAKSSFTAYIRLAPVREGIKLFEDRRAVGSRSTLFRDSYYGSNAFGATVKIDKASWANYEIELGNWREFPVEKLGVGKGGVQIYAIKANISADIEEAKTLKEGKKVKAIVVCKLKSPFITWGGMIQEPTINNPKDFSSISYYLNVALYEIWFYDLESGKILGKVKPSEQNARLTPGTERRQPHVPNEIEILAEGVRVFLRITPNSVIVILKDDKTQQEITNAQVLMKVIDPNGKDQTKASKYENGKGYTADFSFFKTGKYQIMVLGKIGEKKIPAGVYYEVK